MNDWMFLQGGRKWGRYVQIKIDYAVCEQAKAVNNMDCDFLIPGENVALPRKQDITRIIIGFAGYPAGELYRYTISGQAVVLIKPLRI